MRSTHKTNNTHSQFPPSNETTKARLNESSALKGSKQLMRVVPSMAVAVRGLLARARAEFPVEVDELAATAAGVWGGCIFV